ncbi:MAG: NAD-dependent epimerase/dehydratase family protein [Anaerolineaceae bacterium]|nr:NAD-dependent epimerase/dehydratase family protein [Anaerolineaceae bacterium]
MAHYLVTGAAGFIGARVSHLLMAHGHTVSGVDNLNDAYDVRMNGWSSHNTAASQSNSPTGYYHPLCI